MGRKVYRGERNTFDAVVKATTIRTNVGALLLANETLRGGSSHSGSGEGDADDCEDGAEELHDCGGFLSLV